MIVVGIDGGAKGAIAELRDDGSLNAVTDVPTTKQKSGKSTRTRLDEFSIIAILKELKQRCEAEGERLFAFIEEAHPVPAQAKGTPSSNFWMGVSHGTWRTACICLEIPFEEVKSKTWQKHFFEGIQGNKDLKHKSIETAMRMYPSQRDLFVGPRGGAKDGRTDAVLIGEFGRRKLAGGGAKDGGNDGK